MYLFINLEIQINHEFFKKQTKYIQARRDLNPQPTVLETATLPIELLAYTFIRERILD